MLRRTWSAILVLCFVVAGLVAIPPAATATTPTPSWPVKVNGGWEPIVNAYKDDSVTVSPCSDTATTDQIVRIDALGKQKTLLESATATGMVCSPNLILDDGTALINRRPTPYTSELVAWKNGRELWSANTSHTANCGTSRYPQYGTVVNAIAESPDGSTLYTILGGGGDGSECLDRLVGIDRTSGDLVLDRVLYSGVQPTFTVYAQVWTYADHLLVLDRTQTVREFGYNGIEDSTVAYQFPTPAAAIAHYAVADLDGTVFVSGVLGNIDGAYSRMSWHRSDGTYGTVPFVRASLVTQIFPDGAGSVYYLDYNTDTVKTFNLDTETVDTKSLALHAGGSPVAYTQDGDGNGLIVQTYMDGATSERVTDISVIDASTNTATSQADFRQDTDDATLPNAYEYSTSNLAAMVSNETLYYPFCFAQNASCYNAAGVELWIQKIPLSGFGDVLRSNNTRVSVVDERLEYVALGDSFSSGEGVAPFLTGTDRNDDTGTVANEENRCHRSEDAYPMLLEEDDDLNLNLTAFVACSGATTDTLMNGGTDNGSWGEGPQLDALSADTDVVTLTIGGNNIGFAGFALACIGFGCSYDSLTYELVESAIQSSAFHDDLVEAYAAVLTNAPEASVFVLSYPSMTNVESSGCNPIITASKGPMSTMTTLLNVAIMDAYLSIKNNPEYSASSNRLHFVETSGYFEGKDLCAGEESGFNDYSFPTEYSLHPNSIGHTAYYLSMKGQLDD